MKKNKCTLTGGAGDAPESGFSLSSPALFAVSALAALLLFFLNVGVGSSEITVPEVVRILSGYSDPAESSAIIVRMIRMPRAAAALLGGGALAVSGLLLQTFFANPIVEPFILGVSSGSALFAALVVLGGFSLGFKHITPITLFISAFIGAMFVMGAVIYAAKRVKNILTLLIIGIMAGYLCSAGTSILSAFAEEKAIAHFAVWTMGTFAGFTWRHVYILACFVIPSLLFSFCLAKPLNALPLGDMYAGSMGIDVKRVRYAIILLSGILTSAVTAFAGPVSFIGLAVPHMCRILYKTADCRVLIPASALGGAVTAGLCDFMARNILAPRELPLASITALIGAPVVVWLLTARRETL